MRSEILPSREPTIHHHHCTVGIVVPQKFPEMMQLLLLPDWRLGGEWAGCFQALFLGKTWRHLWKNSRKKLRTSQSCYIRQVCIAIIALI